MTVTELTLIYFSIGAPFAVFELVRHRTPLTVARVASFFLTFLLWPLSAFRMLRRRFHTGAAADSFEDKSSEAENRIDEIREALKSIAAADLLGDTVFEFREIFDRYTGLTLAANPKYLDSTVPNEFFRISGRMDHEIADICLNRRNRVKLSRHQTKARESFLEFIDNLPDLSQRIAAAEKALELAYLLNDGTAAGHLENTLKRADTTEVAVWNSDKQQHIQTTPSGIPILTATPGLSKTD